MVWWVTYPAMGAWGGAIWQGIIMSVSSYWRLENNIVPMLVCVFWGALFSPLFPQWRFYGEFFSVDIAGHVLKKWFFSWLIPASVVSPVCCWLGPVGSLCVHWLCFACCCCPIHNYVLRRSMWCTYFFDCFNVGFFTDAISLDAMKLLWKFSRT